MICNDLRIGGTLSGTGISGGTSINSTALHVEDWAPLFGSPGITGTPFEIAGAPGMMLGGDLLGKPRFPSLVMRVTRWAATGIGSLVESDEAEQLQANTDLFLDLASDPETYIEVDMPDGTSRFLQVTSLDAGQATDWRQTRLLTIPFVSHHPWWRAGGNQSSDTLTGANDTLTVAGRKRIYDAVLTASTDMTVTHNDLGWTLEITGSSNPVTIDCGARPRTVIENSVAATNRIRRSSRDWAYFDPGANDITVSAGNLGVAYRASYV